MNLPFVSATHALMWPLLAMVLLSFLVALLLLVRRIAGMKAARKPPQMYAEKPELLNALSEGARTASENYKNLYEMPILFYVLVFAAILSGVKADGAFGVLAWVYVGLRVVHSFIHCSYNNVRHRFYAFIISAGVLMAMFGTLLASL